MSTDKRPAYFQAYNPIFGEIYGFTPGQVGLCFVPMGIGSCLAGGIYLWWDWYLEKVQKRPERPAWTRKEEFNRLPLACLGGPLFVSMDWYA